MIDREKFAAGDHGVFRRLMAEYGPLVLAVVVSFARDGDHADDLYQDVWIKVYVKRGTYEGRGPFPAWLHRVAARVCLMDYRERRGTLRWIRDLHELREVKPESGRKRPDALEELQVEEVQVRLHRAMAQLHVRELEAITLRILEGRSPNEVAEIMGVKPSSVRSLVRHGIEHLRRILEGEIHDLS